MGMTRPSFATLKDTVLTDEPPQDAAPRAVCAPRVTRSYPKMQSQGETERPPKHRHIVTTITMTVVTPIAPCSQYRRRVTTVQVYGALTRKMEARDTSVVTKPRSLTDSDTGPFKTAPSKVPSDNRPGSRASSAVLSSGDITCRLLIESEAIESRCSQGLKLFKIFCVG